MKLIPLLTALTLFMFLFACNNQTGKKSKVQRLVMQDIKSNAPPASESEQTQITSPKITNDEEVKTEDKSVADTDGINQVMNTEEYDRIIENEFLTATDNPLSTFSIDVDEAAYSNIRRYLQSGSLPPNGAVRIEEMINYFDYAYPQPTNDEPFSVNTEIADCPWNPVHKLIHIGLQGKEIPADNLPAANLVFLIDVSGSMSGANKLPLVQASLNILVDRLRENDKVAIVVYAGNAGLVCTFCKRQQQSKNKRSN